MHSATKAGGLAARTRVYTPPCNRPYIMQCVHLNQLQLFKDDQTPGMGTQMPTRASRVVLEIEAIGTAEAAAKAPAAAAAVKSKGNTVDPPLLQQCLRRGCIQDKKAELPTSIYLISLLRVISLLKAPRPAEIGRTGPRGFYYTLVQEGGGEGGASHGGGESGGGGSESGGGGRGGGEGAAARRIRCLAAAGWIILFLIAAACQFFLFVLILETSTSHTCDVKSQNGCRPGEYCSFSIAKGQCNDCSAILPETSICCPTLNTTCPTLNTILNITDPYDYTYTTNNVTAPNSDLCYPDSRDEGCPHVCRMYEHCQDEASLEKLPQRCDFLVNARDGVKWSHILLFIFGALLWTRDLVNVLDETDLMAATVPKATGEVRKTHNVIVSSLCHSNPTHPRAQRALWAPARPERDRGCALTACVGGMPHRCCCSVSCSH